MMQRNCVVFTASAFLFLIVFVIPSLIASPENPQSAIQNLSSTAFGEPKLDTSSFAQKTKKLQIPFIANNGQVDEQVRFYANTFGGTVFVTKDGEIVYALPDVGTQCLASSMHSPKGIRNVVGMLHDDHVSDILHPAAWIVDHDKPEFRNPQSAIRSVAIKETLVGGRVQEITGNEKAATKVNYFKGKDPSKWKANISTYETVSLGEVYDGIELKLKAYGSNVEKLFCVKPGANPEYIKVRLSGIQPARNPPPESPSVRGTGSCPPLAGAGGGSGARGLSVNGHGELVAETALGPVKFTKPVAYQVINGKRVEIECGYVITDVTTDFTDYTDHVDQVGWVKRSAPNKKGDGKDGFASLNPSYTNCIQEPEAKSKKLEAGGKRLIGSREKGMGRRGAYLASNFRSPAAYHQSAIQNLSSTSIGDPQLEYGFKVASYDKSHDLIIDPLLASTYLGGSGSDVCYSLALDTNGNVYVTGSTYSTDFPTTTGAYGTSGGGSYNDIFIARLNNDLTNLTASTYLGGSKNESVSGIALDSTGNVYVTGSASATDFPTTTGAYDTSGGGEDYGDAFIARLSNDLTRLTASTYLGGSKHDPIYGIVLDSTGNVYVTGFTTSTDFPTTTGAYNTSGGDSYSNAFIARLDSDLTKLSASTCLGGTSGDYAYDISLDSGGNVYVTGITDSTNFPTTTGVYDTSGGGTYGDSSYPDIFIAKLNGDLTKLSASTYLGGSLNDEPSGISFDSSGNVYVTGSTSSTDFPTTSGAYNTSNNGSYDIFVSKLASNLASLSASTYLGGSSSDGGTSITLDSGGNVCVTGSTSSGDFPTTKGAYDTSGGSYGGAFIAKLSGDLTRLSASTYLVGSDWAVATDITLDSDGNVYVTGYTDSTDFPTTSNAYDISSNGSYDIFISKLDSNLSASVPTVTTNTATNVTQNSVILNGTVNANNQSTTFWFDYGETSGSYDMQSSTETVVGSSNTAVSIAINGLSPATTYYYRIVAESDAGTSYGDEMSFTTLPDTTNPTGYTIVNNNDIYAISTTVTLTLSVIDDVGVTGYYVSENLTTPSTLNPGWTSISSTSDYSASVSYTLSDGDGDKTIYVWYKDDSGNVSSPASDSVIIDTTPPIVTITSPTSDDTYTTTNGKMKVGGSATDSTSGINEITWSNNFGISGTANGTIGWSILKISLLIGENTITVIATDNAGNTGTDVITVNRTEGGQGSISGYVVDIENNPIENAKVRIKKKNSAEKTVSDEDGFFEFEDLDAGTYTVITRKIGYKISRKTVKLKDDEDVEIEIKMRRQ